MVGSRMLKSRGLSYVAMAAIAGGLGLAALRLHLKLRWMERRRAQVQAMQDAAERLVADAVETWTTGYSKDEQEEDVSGWGEFKEVGAHGGVEAVGVSGGEEDGQVRSQMVSAQSDLVFPLAAHHSVFSSRPGLRLRARHQHAHGSLLSPHHRVCSGPHDILSLSLLQQGVSPLAVQTFKTFI